MNKLNKETKRSNTNLGLNQDRLDAFWQWERGHRYGNKRKMIAKLKVLLRKADRQRNKQVTKQELEDND